MLPRDYGCLIKYETKHSKIQMDQVKCAEDNRTLVTF